MLKGKERIVRLTPDLQRLELRLLDKQPQYKIDKFFKIESLEGVFISNFSRLRLKKFNALKDLYEEAFPIVKSQNYKSRERKKP